MRRHLVAALALAAVFAWLPVDASAQCAMCRRALLSPEGQHMVAAFRSGILLLLVSPFAAFATVAVLAVRAQRRAKHDAMSSST
jgi:hypothetical protein